MTFKLKGCAPNEHPADLNTKLYHPTRRLCGGMDRGCYIISVRSKEY